MDAVARRPGRRRHDRADRREPGHERAPRGRRRGHVLAPAFVDPHVHLRTPGREDEETVARHAAAAAGGYCAILAMPNTDPIVDSAAVLGSLIDERAREARCRSASSRRSRRARRARADRDGRARRGGAGASPTTGGPRLRGPHAPSAPVQPASPGGVGVHCEEPTLSRDGAVHEGAVSARARLPGYPRWPRA